MFLTAEGILKLLRVQNHDYLNHLQVIAGYLQLGRSQEALYYLREAVEAIQSQSTIMRWVHPTAVILLFQLQLKLAEAGKKLIIDSETDLKEIAIPEDDLNELLNTLLEMGTNHCKEECEELLLRISEDSISYYFELDSLWDKNGLDNVFQTVKEQAEGIGCQLNWVLAAKGQRIRCTVPKKNQWLVAE